MTSYHECKCGHEIDIYVECPDYAEIPEDCPECEYKFSPLEQEKMFSKAIQDAIESLTDYATDRNR